MSTSLINGLGGPAGFGENTLFRNDDDSSALINLSSIFPGGIQIGSQTFYDFYVNNNGNISFGQSYSIYTPFNIVTTSALLVAPFFADVDTRAGIAAQSLGGTSTGSNSIYWDIDEVNNKITVTWDDVSFYDNHLRPTNAFQLVLANRGLGELGIDFRYEDVNWLVGDASGDVYARAGYFIGNDISYELPQSGSLLMLDLESASNVGIPGLYQFNPYINRNSLLSISPASTSLDEVNSGTTTFTYTVTRGGLLTGGSSVDWSLSGTGENPVNSFDFVGSILPLGTLNFAAGETSKTISIGVTGDSVFEPDETFSITLANPSSNVSITTATASGTIVNDDLPVITLDVVPAAVAEDGSSNLVYTFTRNGPTTSTLTVNYGISGTADASDYTGATPGAGKTISFAAGSATATLTIYPTGDTIIEGDETILFTLAAGTGYTIGTTATVTGTIVNDETQVSVTAIANGNEANGSPAVFRFSRTGPTTDPLSVSYRLLGTAQAGSDYSGATSGTMSFSAGSATVELSLSALADSLIDPGETIIAQILPSTTATPSYLITPGQQTATATITAEGMVVTVNGPSRPGWSKGEVGNGYAFAALKSDGTVVCWGDPSTGGTSPAGLGGVSQQAVGVCQ